MSQSRNVPEDPLSDGGQVNQNFSLMMVQGRTLSGNERNCVFLNTGAGEGGGERFATISAVSGLDFPDDGRAVVVVDWDHDGDQDLWISNRNAPRLRYLRNNLPRANNFLALRLTGNGSTTNRDAIGARVEVVLRGAELEAGGQEAANPQSAIGNPKLIKTLRAGEGFLAQSSKWLHFGLGEASEIERVDVRWPGGDVQRFTDLEVNTHHHLIQGITAAESEIPAGRGGELTASNPTPTGPLDTIRVPLIPLVPMPNLNYVDLDGNRTALLSTPGRSVLINCWSATCEPCLKELAEFSERVDEIRDAGIEIVALSVDGLNAETATADATEGALRGLNFPFPVGYATREVAQVLNLIQTSMTASARQLPVPVSFLVDDSGRLAVIYEGPLTIEDLLTDVGHSALPPLERFQRSSMFDGSVIPHDAILQSLRSADITARLGFAGGLAKLDLAEEAMRQYTAVLDLNPNCAPAQAALGQLFREQAARLAESQEWGKAADAFRKSLELRPRDAASHYNLANVYQRLNDARRARQHYEESIRIEPELIEAHNNLGRLLAKLKKWDEAEPYMKMVAEHRPDDAESRYNTGVVLAQLDRWHEAMPHFQAALRIQPDFPQARKYLDRARTAIGVESGGQGK